MRGRLLALAAASLLSLAAALAVLYGREIDRALLTIRAS